MTLSIGLWGPQYDISRKVTTSASFDFIVKASGQKTLELFADAREKGVYTDSQHNIIKLDIPKVSRHRVQLFSSQSGRVIADSRGTQAQKKAYKELISGTGYAADSGTYALKITDAAGNDHSNYFTHSLHIGTNHTSSYRVTGRTNGAGWALMGNSSGYPEKTAYNPTAAAATYWSNQNHLEKQEANSAWKRDAYA